MDVAASSPQREDAGPQQSRTASGDSRTAVLRLEGHGNEEVRSIAVLPCGKVVTGSSAGKVRVFSKATGQRLYESHFHPGTVECVTGLGHDVFASCDWQGRGRIRITRSTGESLHLEETDGGSWTMAAIESGRILVAGDHGDLVFFSNGEGYELSEIHRQRAHRAIINDVVSHNGKILTASQDKTAAVWDLATKSRVAELSGHTETLRCAAMDDRWIVTGGDDKSIRLYDAITFSLMGVFNIHTGSVRNLTLLHGRSETFVLSASHDSSVCCTGLSSGRVHRSSLSSPIFDVVIVDSRWFAVCGRNGLAELRRLPIDLLQDVAARHESTLFRPVVPGARDLVMVDGFTRGLERYAANAAGNIPRPALRITNGTAQESDTAVTNASSDLNRFQIPSQVYLQPVTTGINRCFDSFEGSSRIAVASGDTRVRIYSTSGDLLRTFSPNVGIIQSLTMLDRDTVVAGLEFRRRGLRVFHIPTETISEVALDTVQDGCWAIAMQDAERFVLGDHWDLCFYKKSPTPGATRPTMQEVHRVRAHRAIINGIAARGNIVVSGSQDNTAAVWDGRSYAQLATLVGHTDILRSVDISDRLIATAGDDGTIRTYNSASFDVDRVIRVHHKSVRRVRLIADGRYILSASEDQMLCFTDVATGIPKCIIPLPFEVWDAKILEGGLIAASGSGGKTVLISPPPAVEEILAGSVRASPSSVVIHANGTLLTSSRETHTEDTSTTVDTEPIPAPGPPPRAFDIDDNYSTATEDQDTELLEEAVREGLTIGHWPSTQTPEPSNSESSTQMEDEDNRDDMSDTDGEDNSDDSSDISGIINGEDRVITGPMQIPTGDAEPQTEEEERRMLEEGIERSMNFDFEPGGDNSAFGEQSSSPVSPPPQENQLAEGEPTSGGIACVVCMDSRVNAVLIPCGHTSCKTCARALLRRRQGCAICRKRFTIQNLYL